jgi:hypothetical protein
MVGPGGSRFWSDLILLGTLLLALAPALMCLE